MSKRLDDILKKINETYGQGTIGTLGKMPKQEIEVVSSGSLMLDKALGVGGYPRGRIIEIYGPESSGKTTLTIHAIAEVQKKGMKAAFIDMEHAFDPHYATQLGVNIDDLVFTQPDTGEQAWEILQDLVDTEEFSLIIIDSVAAMVPKRELEGEIGDAVVGLQAKMMAQGLRTSVGRIKKCNTTVVFINQIRDNVGVMYGPSEITTGGKSLKFYATMRLEVRKSEAVKQGEVVVANKTKVKVIKNKVAPPLTTAEFNILFGVGIDKVQEVVDICVECDIIKKSGAWYAYGDTKLGQGMPAVRALLNDNPELLEELELKAREVLNQN